MSLTIARTVTLCAGDGSLAGGGEQAHRRPRIFAARGGLERSRAVGEDSGTPGEQRPGRDDDAYV